VMKRENLVPGKKYRITRTIADAEGALYMNDTVTLINFTIVSAKDDNGIVLFVEDELGKHHTVGLHDLKEL